LTELLASQIQTNIEQVMIERATAGVNNVNNNGEDVGNAEGEAATRF